MATKASKGKSCLPLITIGCNDIYGDFCTGPGCPYVACCGSIVPGKTCKIYPTCPSEKTEPNNIHFKDTTATCVCGCCISTPLCLLCYGPCYLLSCCCPLGYINAGPPCWCCCCSDGCRFHDCGGKGYDQLEWYGE